MPKLQEGEKKWILEERLDTIFRLMDKGYNDAQIARIMFNIDRSAITRIKNTHFAAFKAWVLSNAKR